MEQPAPEATEAAPDTDWAATKVHVGKCKGMELRDLSPEQIKPMIDIWMPEKLKAGAKLLADDKRLMAALEQYAAQAAAKAPAPAEDDVPY